MRLNHLFFFNSFDMGMILVSGFFLGRWVRVESVNWFCIGIFWDKFMEFNLKIPFTKRRFFFFSNKVSALESYLFGGTEGWYTLLDKGDHFFGVSMFNL